LERFVLTDINNDGVLDLVAPQFGMSNKRGHPVSARCTHATWMARAPRF
jgi:hypothetical protein